jgi:rhamnose utilization protein RhaD (predicted bifunctional aldolase and dehydrogenase)
MVPMYAIAAFRNNPVAASIDTPLHGFLPFPHVDHLHPDWGIALAASANGKTKDGRVQSRVQPLPGLGSLAAPRL